MNIEINENFLIYLKKFDFDYKDILKVCLFLICSVICLVCWNCYGWYLFYFKLVDLGEVVGIVVV